MQHFAINYLALVVATVVKINPAAYKDMRR